MNDAPRIAVSGLHRGENPQPGSGIVRSIRARFPSAYIVGLVYDAMESGIYSDNGPDLVFSMPYPTSGSASFLGRLDTLLATSPIDLLIPTLDAEIELLVHLEDDLAERGLLTYLPDQSSLRRRAKNHLPELAANCGVDTPETAPVHDLAEARAAARTLGYPLLVKGQYYDAHTVSNDGELEVALAGLFAQWGAPAILQRCIHGAEYDALGIGDGEGGILGLCCVRKTIVSEKGKGLGGMTVRDPELEGVVARLIRELRWRGPFEVEVIREEATGRHSLIEINPRFPAWVHFPTLIGFNFPAMLVEMMTTGVRPARMDPCPAGHFFLRHQIEVTGHVDQLSALSSGRDLAPLQTVP